MSKSIMQSEKVCYISGSPIDLEMHHVFFGAGRRELSEKYGLTVWLRHDLHNEPPYGAHHCKRTRRMLEQAGQKAFQEKYPDLDFMKIFGRNYL